MSEPNMQPMPGGSERAYALRKALLGKPATNIDTSALERRMAESEPKACESCGEPAIPGKWHCGDTRCQCDIRGISYPDY